MASRASVTAGANAGVEVQNPATYVTSTSGGGGGGGGGRSTSFQGIENQQALDMLMAFLQQQAAGGSEEYKKGRAERQAEISSTRQGLAGYTKEAAFKDAADLMAQQLRLSLEKNMPAISKAIQGAGTSASSMQGLLSQKLATESAQAAGALGAEQAKAYGGISAQLRGVLEALTRTDNTLAENLARGLALTQTSRSESVTNPTNPMNPNTQVTPISQGSSWQPFPQQQMGGMAPVQSQTQPAQTEGGFISITPRDDPFALLNESGFSGLPSYLAYQPQQPINSGISITPVNSYDYSRDLRDFGFGQTDTGYTDWGGEWY